jgi:hypothetical protein
MPPLRPSYRGLLSNALLLSAALILFPGILNAANKQSKQAPLLGSHPSAVNRDARLAVTRQHSATVPPTRVRSVGVVNSLNPRPGKTIVRGHRTYK